jgi:hypothetical protein
VQLGLHRLDFAKLDPGFVLTGIPMYYITRHGASIPLQSRFGARYNFHHSDNTAYQNLFTAFLSPLLSRLCGQSTGTPGFGWQAVATDGDDGIEMSEGSR